MRPLSITTAAWMSPCREVPQPRYVPSLYCGFAGAGGGGAGATGACSATAAGSSATGAGSDAVAGGRVSGTTGAGVARRTFLITARLEGGGVAAGAAATAGTSRGAGGRSVLSGAALGGAGIAGLRPAACTANRSAAVLVRTYPAAYTASTAAELNATRLFATFLFEPFSDTVAIIG